MLAKSARRAAGKIRQRHPLIGWKIYRWRRKAVRIVCRRLYTDRNRNPARSIIVAGTGRSGTTWLADILGWQIPARIMFEPFHAERVEGFSQFQYFHYLRPTESNPPLHSFCEQVLAGRIRHNWIDSQVERIFPQYRVIKEIRANLFLAWLHHEFPMVPILFILRHPCAVVLSRMQLGWAAKPDLEPFLCQKKLVSDFLEDKLDRIRGAETEEEKHAIVWSVSNLVPIRQFTDLWKRTFFYENLCIRPEVELPRVFSLAGQPYHESMLKYVDRPSMLSQWTSPVVTAENKLTNWKRCLSPAQIDRILAIVEYFGLGHLYGDSELPLALQF